MEWINSEERKPDAVRLVLIYTPNRTIHESNVLMGTYWKDTDSWTVWDFERAHDYKVTHWKEIPDPPL